MIKNYNEWSFFENKCSKVLEAQYIHFIVEVDSYFERAVYVWFFAGAKLNSRRGRHIGQIKDGRHLN